MKTTVNYNNAIITLGGNSAVLITEASYKQNKYKSFASSSAFCAALVAFDFILDKVSDNTTITKEITRIYVPDMLKGFAMGTFIEYIRTNQTSSGRAFTDEEKTLVHSIANKLMTKGFNLKIVESKFMAKELKPMKDRAIEVAKQMKSTPAQAAPQAQPQAKSPVIAKLEELMTKALEEGDFDTYDKLEARLNNLTKSTPAASAPVVEEEPVEEECYDDLEDNEVEVDEDIANMDC